MVICSDTLSSSVTCGGNFDNGENYYIVEEIIYLDKQYIYGIPCNVEKDEINMNEAVILEVSLKQNEIIFNEIENSDLSLIILKLFQQKFQEIQE